MCTSSVKMYAKEIKEAIMQKDFIYENYLKMPDDLEFEQAMKVYEELLEENLEEDEIYDKLWDHDRLWKPPRTLEDHTEDRQKQ